MYLSYVSVYITMHHSNEVTLVKKKKNKGIIWFCVNLHRPYSISVVCKMLFLTQLVILTHRSLILSMTSLYTERHQWDYFLSMTSYRQWNDIKWWRHFQDGDGDCNRLFIIKSISKALVYNLMRLLMYSPITVVIMW